VRARADRCARLSARETLPTAGSPHNSFPAHTRSRWQRRATGSNRVSSDLDAPRHWVHYLYVQDEPQARSAAEVVSAAGWQIQRVDVRAGDGPEWVVIAKGQAITSLGAVREARLFFEGVAATHEGGDYDGWEASLWVRNRPANALCR
jgi:hypothetical protein